MKPIKPLTPIDRYPNLAEVNFVNVPRIVAKWKIKMYAGGGIEFHHDTEKIHEAWHKIAENNDAYNFIFERLMDVSATGGTIIAVEQTKSGIPVWTYADPYLMNGIEQSYATHDMAVIIQKVKIDNAVHYLKTAYDKEYIYRTLWSLDNQKESAELLGFVTKLPPEKQADFGDWNEEKGCFIYKHGLGMIPFVVITNEPFLQTWPMFNASNFFTSPLSTSQRYGQTQFKWQFNAVSDTATCDNLCRGLQYCYNQMFKTMQLDKPRVVITNASQYMQNELARGKNCTDLAMQDILYFANAPATAQTKINTLSLTNSIDKYANLSQTIWSDIFKCAGLDWIVQSGTNKTTAENYLNFANTTVTVKTMKQTITPKILQLIKISLKFMGYELGDSKTWNLLVKSNIPTDMSSLRQDLSIDLKNGIIDQADVYSILYGVDRDNAENKVKQVKEFNKKMGFDPMQQNVDGVSYPKDGQSSSNSKNAGRKSDVEKNKKE